MVYSAASNTLWIWLLETADLITTITHHEKPILCVTAFRTAEAFADDVRPAVIVTGDTEGGLAVFHMETYTLMHDLVGHSGPVYCVEVARTSRPVLVSGGFDHTARVWDIMDGDLLYVIDDNHCPIFSLNILNTPRLGVLLGTADGKVRAYDIADGSFVFELLGHTGPVKGVASTLCPRPFILSGSHDNTSRIWDLTIRDNEGCQSAAGRAIKDIFEWKDLAATALEVEFVDSDAEEGEEGVEGSNDGYIQQIDDGSEDSTKT